MAEGHREGIQWGRTSSGIQKLPLSHTSARFIPPRLLAQSTLISLLINPASVLGVAVYKLSQSQGSLWRPGISFFLKKFMFFYLFIYLFMTVSSLRFCARAFSSCGKWGPRFIAVRGPLTITASLVAEHRLQMRRLSNCGSRAQLLRGMWDLQIGRASCRERV